MTYYKKPLGNVMSAFRRLCRLSQPEIADIIECSVKQYALYESGLATISLAKLTRFAGAVGEPVEKFYKEDNERRS